MARPSAKKIIKDNLNRIEKWVANGLTMKEIAKNLGISERTLYKYKATDPQFMQTVKKGRQVAVEILENTMFKSATGFTQSVKKYEKVKRIKYKDGKKLEEYEEMVEYTEEVYFKPDITAGIFLLKNWGNYVNEPRVLEIRQKELELAERKLEDSEW
jgi:transposase